MIPPALPLSFHLSIHVPVLASRSHLVAQQHDDHVLLSVLMDLCQPRLEMEGKGLDGKTEEMNKERERERLNVSLSSPPPSTSFFSLTSIAIHLLSINAEVF